MKKILKYLFEGTDFMDIATIVMMLGLLWFLCFAHLDNSFVVKAEDPLCGLDVVVCEGEELDIIPADAKGLVDYWGKKYLLKDEDIEFMKKVLYCESGFRMTDKEGKIIEGDIGARNGSSLGIAQFQKPTFDRYKKMYGVYELDRTKLSDQIRLMAIMFGDKQDFHWTCAGKVK